MTLNKLNETWKIIKQNKFEEVNEISNDFLCSICRKLLTNAHSAPCGCRYCFECIQNYLNNDESYCPGSTEYCKDEVLNLANNVHVEHSINRQISKLIVKCPVKDCQFQDELGNIGSHLRACNFRSENCLYFNVGCKQPNVTSDNIKSHLSDEIVSHSKLLLELVNNLENEMGVLKNEIEQLKLDRNSNEMKINELERKDRINKDEIVELNEEMVFLKNENRQLRSEIEVLNVNRNIKEMIRKEMPIKEVEEIKQKSELTYQKQNKMENLIHEILSSHDDLTTKSDNQTEKIDKTINYFKMKISELEEKVGVKEIRCEYDWTIDNFNHKWYQTEQNSKIFSKPFYSHKNGYKMCLCLNPTGHFTSKRKFLSIDFHIMKGEHDDYLAWPFKHGIKIILINQSTGIPHVSIPLEFEDCPIDDGWKKPTDDKNKPITCIRLIDIAHLLKNPSLYMKDQIIIKCQINVVF